MNSNLDEDAKIELANSTPLGRIGTPKEAANVIEFLCSEKANFITGQVILCDGGFLY